MPDITCWLDERTLRVRRDDLPNEVLDRMAPEVEQRVRSIVHEARYDLIMFNVGDGPFNVTEHDLAGMCEALDTSGALWRARPVTVKKVDGVKRMPIAEFREKGYLHEVNRLLLHPLGLALEVDVDGRTGEETLGGVWDYRDDPEGIVYADDLLSYDKAAFVTSERDKRLPARTRQVGFWVQPVSPPIDEEAPNA